MPYLSPAYNLLLPPPDSNRLCWTFGHTLCVYGADARFLTMLWRPHLGLFLLSGLKLDGQTGIVVPMDMGRLYAFCLCMLTGTSDSLPPVATPLWTTPGRFLLQPTPSGRTPRTCGDNYSKLLDYTVCYRTENFFSKLLCPSADQ